jgi:hypothetical protein
LSWPDWYGDGFAVEITTNIVSNKWSAEGGVPAQVDNQFIFTTAVAGTKFFRLKKTAE